MNQCLFLGRFRRKQCVFHDLFVRICRGKQCFIICVSICGAIEWERVFIFGPIRGNFSVCHCGHKQQHCQEEGVKGHSHHMGWIENETQQGLDDTKRSIQSL